jgi:LmbE family N-acetylglucosaminyl deacetylase
VRQTVVVLALLALALPASARTRAAHPPKRILWIGAHPDDEIFLSPILGRECSERGAQCTLLVMTQGENGGSPAVRAAEMQSAADLLHASLTLWTFADAMSDVDATWSAAAGGHDALVARVAAEIAAVSPTVVYTFDPRHGTTCHPAHRAVAALVIEALGRTNFNVPLYLVETTPQFESAVTTPIVVDATATWSYFVRDAQAHASQFPPERVDSFAALPAEKRRVYLIDAASAARSTYTLACP